MITMKQENKETTAREEKNLTFDFKVKAPDSIKNLIVDSQGINIAVRCDNVRRVTTRLHGEKAKENERNPQISMFENCETLSIKVNRSKDSTYSDTVLEIIIPEDENLSSLSLESGNGDIMLESIKKCDTAKINSTCGNIIIKGTVDCTSISANTQLGNITIDTSCKNLELSNGLGNIIAYVKAKEDQTSIKITNDEGNTVLRLSQISEIIKRIIAQKSSIVDNFICSKKGFSAELDFKTTDGELRLL